MRAALFLVVALSAPLLSCANGGDAYTSVPPNAPNTPSSGDAGTSTDASCAPVAALPQRSQITVGATLPALSFETMGEDGRALDMPLAALQDRCSPHASLLILRATAAWCGTCRWHGAHTAAVVSDRVRLVDMLVGDADNNVPTTRDLAAWRSLLDVPASVLTVVDGAFSLASVSPASAPLPLYVLVNARTMQVHSYGANPDPDDLRTLIDTALASFDGAPAPTSRALHAAPLHDQIFDQQAWDMIADMGRVEPLPPDPSNAVADVPAAVALGKLLFSDAALSPTGTVSCATCHRTDRAMSDGLATAKGVAKGARKTPRITHAAFSRWQFWDGRSDSLWAQALGPFENPAEFNASRLFVLHRIRVQYASMYNTLFHGTPLPAPEGLPLSGKPGDAAYDALSDAQKQDVTRVFVNVGKALAAYERTFRAAPSAIDAYARGDTNALSLDQKQSLRTFFVAGCAQCHWGPRLTDDAFHVTRVGTGAANGQADTGRSAGLADMATSEFLRSGRWSDMPMAAMAAPFKPASTRTLGAFKTPSLRGVAIAGPYGHGGTQPSLVSVMDGYGRGGLAPGDARAVGRIEAWLPGFDEVTSWALTPFVSTLTDAPLLP